MREVIWPNHLAAIKEVVWRVRKLVSLRSPGTPYYRRQHKEGILFITAKSSYHEFSDTTHHHVDFHMHGAIVYRGDGFTHDAYDLKHIIEGRDILRRLMVLDDLGDIR